MQITVPGDYSSEHAGGGGIYRGAHLAYLHRTKEKNKQKQTNEIKTSVTNRGIQVVVLLYRMFFVVFSIIFLLI